MVNTPTSELCQAAVLFAAVETRSQKLGCPAIIAATIGLVTVLSMDAHYFSDINSSKFMYIEETVEGNVPFQATINLLRYLTIAVG